VTTGVGLGVGVDVGFGVGVVVGVGVTGVAVAVGAKVGTLVGVARGVCPVAVEPQAARAKTAIAMLQRMNTKRFLLEFFTDENERVNGVRNLRCRIVFLIYLPDEKTYLNDFFIAAPYLYTDTYVRGYAGKTICNF
jgi:hypothetical protein